MENGRCSIYTSRDVVYIVPENNGNSNDNRDLVSMDQAVWAPKDNYGAWTTDVRVDADSDFNGRQSHTRSGSEPPDREPPNYKSKIPPPGDVQPTNRSKEMAKLLFRTKMCYKYLAGTCPNITNCDFAHSIEELRRPPPNWQELIASYEEERAANELREELQVPSQSSSRGLHCKKFLNKEDCPYGDYCVFLHDEQSRARESVAISLGPGSRHKYFSSVSAGSSGASLSKFKPVNWKTKICYKWEQTGHCSYGDKCNFAHGTAELQLCGGKLVESEGKNISSPLDAKQGMGSSKSPGNTIVASAPSVPYAENYHREILRQKAPNVQMAGQISHQKWKGSDKISLIYGDWFEDLV